MQTQMQEEPPEQPVAQQQEQQQEAPQHQAEQPGMDALSLLMAVANANNNDDGDI